MIINENYKIESDGFNVTLLEKRRITGTGRGKPTTKKVGDEYFMPVAYFSNPENALQFLVEKEVMGTGMEDLKTVVEKIRELEKLINSLKVLPRLSLKVP